MARLLPGRKESQEWGPMDWVRYITGVIGIVSAVAVGVTWVWNQTQKSEERRSAEVKTEVEEAVAPTPVPTGRLRLSFFQGGEQVAIKRLEADLPSVPSYAYDVVLKKGAFQVRAPRTYCDGSVDVVDAGIFVRLMPTSRLNEVAAELEGPNGRNFDAFFGLGQAFATPYFTLTELLVRGPPEFEGDEPFNYFHGDGFADATPEAVTMAINTVENLATNEQYLESGIPFLMLFGVEDAQCQPNGAPGMELTRVQFE